VRDKTGAPLLLVGRLFSKKNYFQIYFLFSVTTNFLIFENLSVALLAFIGLEFHDVAYEPYIIQIL